MRSKQEYLLTTSQLESLKEHENKISHKIMKKFQIFVCTIGCLADHRIYGYAKKHPISTIVLDEAAQLNHPSTLVLFTLNPSRVVFGGDHMQLSSTIKSYAADVAGLSLSFMEMSSWIMAR